MPNIQSSAGKGTSQESVQEEGVVLECQDLSFSYNSSKPIFKDVNLLTHKDEFVAVVGPTGTGKSTFLRVLARLIPPTSGRVLLDGAEVIRPSSRISLIHQSIATFPWMTALDNVKLSLKHSDLSWRQENDVSERMLDLVGLRDVEKDYPKEMSGGMRQKIAIARALAASPEVLLMDEPFVHMDELTAAGLRREVYQLVFNPETTLQSVILVSHNLHEVVQLADRVYVMNGSPATMTDVIKIDLPRPRSERDPRFFEYLDRLTAGLGMDKLAV